MFVIYTIFKKPIHACADPLLPFEQVRFRCGSTTVDQADLLTQIIEDCFEAKKAGDMFVNLTVTYDTVWHHGFTYKLLRFLPDKHMIRMIMEHIQNRMNLQNTVSTHDLIG